MKYIEAVDIHKTFHLGKHTVPVLRGASISVDKGEWVALLGASGSGKTTLLDIVGTISRPDSGNLCIDGEDMKNALINFYNAIEVTLPDDSFYYE